MQHKFRIVKIAPDGKCMFRALASGMSYNQGFYIVGSEEEESDAGEIQLACETAVKAQCLRNTAERPSQVKVKHL